MKLGIEWSQASTKRGAVGVFVGIIGAIGYYLGKDIQPVIVLGQSIVGILGLTIKD
jgi:hypothetical protein